MGLDMYLEGRKYLWTNWREPEKNRTEDGFEIGEITLRLGYWRKHPNLHGYIVQTFADGRDDCQDIELGEEDVINIIEAVQNRRLEPTEGFFFGQSEDSQEQRDKDVAILLRALDWLHAGEPTPDLSPGEEDVLGRESGGLLTVAAVITPETKFPTESRYLVYRASW